MNFLISYDKNDYSLHIDKGRRMTNIHHLSDQDLLKLMNTISKVLSKEYTIIQKDESK